MPETFFLVGEFSRLTHLSAKTLRHYHDVELLVPALIDPLTGYRHYTPDQIPDAQLIRRLRDVRMPVPHIRDVLTTTDPNTRNTLISEHLDQLKRDLAATATALLSLHQMLHHTDPALAVTYRPGTQENALVLTDEVGHDDLAPWAGEVFPRLFTAAQALQVAPSGVGGALYSGDWFTGQDAAVTALLPVTAAPAAGDEGTDLDVQVRVLESQPYAIAVHRGPYADIDRTYGALGEHVHAEGIAAPGPIRENYLVSPAETDDPGSLCTEVCWPITHIPA
ncbi:MerR family transcriptional regulator [Kineosporia sp. NBRC 101731]|uniref:MerR family transcriptional regulator n=1 Tax=Kineosporia sp. NBRC 101731 TaxID=3032199 RepID=UPI0024A469B1|nr:MerR family transcriptional regulator [Kineosporia sp. NBRC 101731]GLY29323.1 MerR family transcriptional regulator [Kineosporia sp. NBRC 101731]